MSVSLLWRSAVIALALVPAVLQAADSAAPAGARPVSPAARALALSAPVRVGAKSGKSSHILGLGLLGTLLVAAGAVAATVVVADSVDSGSSG